MHRALGLVKTFQLPAKPMHCHPDKGIPLLAKVLVLAEDFRGNAEFLDFQGVSADGFLAEILQELRQGGRAKELSGMESSVQF